MSHSERQSQLWQTAQQLSKGDTVQVVTAERTRSLIVEDAPTEVIENPFRCNGLFIVFQDSNELEYTMDIPERAEMDAQLTSPTNPFPGESVFDLKIVPTTEIPIQSNITAADLGIPPR